MNGHRFMDLHIRRCLDERNCIPFERYVQFAPFLVRRLGLSKKLLGHHGCVNCLQWNWTGSLLISGSDDCELIVWEAGSGKKLTTVSTGHVGNIFSVKYIPGTSDNTVASGAADCNIRVHDLDTRSTSSVCSCHLGRVKRLATAPSVPFVFWSAAEDGLILQFDTRIAHSCQRPIRNTLIDLNQHLQTIEAKCIDVNPLRPELLAVGGNDPYVRLYDRRMIPKRKFETESNQNGTFTQEDADADRRLPQTCATYYVAGHLPSKKAEYDKKFRLLSSTYVTFSPDGTELLANLGGEQIYLFDIIKSRSPLSYATPKLEPNQSIANGFTSQAKSSPPKLTPEVELVKKRANECFEKGKASDAITLYNIAISRCPEVAVLYSNRAAALIKRNWDGDLYAALRDCHEALRLDSKNMKAHFRLIRCLFELKWFREASKCLEQFKSMFVMEASTHALTALERDIKSAIADKETKKTNGCCKDDGQKNVRIGLERPEPITHYQVTGQSEQEEDWQAMAYDYKQRFCGHCNTTTDIKEANFLGSSHIVAGSDDGFFFIWEKNTTNIVRVIKGDDSIVNCLQPHPTTCMLASSGIEPVVRIWTPRDDQLPADEDDPDDKTQAIASENQTRMNANPVEVMFMNRGRPGPEDTDEERPRIVCRPS
ncbi:WD and tetratricopeptide repeats protein 1 [Halotydeus destructor]|nr:WD and tetratricopeptide repeats protein 1 [Halotydeus destructor]